MRNETLTVDSDNFPFPLLLTSDSGKILKYNKAAIDQLESNYLAHLIDVFDSKSVNDLKDVMKRLKEDRLASKNLDVYTFKRDQIDVFKTPWSIHITMIDNENFSLLAYRNKKSGEERELEKNKHSHRKNLTPQRTTNDSYLKVAAFSNLLRYMPYNTYQVNRFSDYIQVKDLKEMILRRDNRTGNFWQDIREDLAEDIWEMTRLAQKDEQVQTQELLIKNGEEEVFWVSLNCISSEGRHFITYTDITAQKKATEQMVRDDRVNTIGILAGGLAHQYNNLHHAVIALIHQASQSEGSKQKEFLNSATSLLSSGVTLSRSLLSHLRESDTKEIYASLKKVFERVELLTRDELIALKCKIVFPSETDYMVKANPTNLDQVFVNLIMNAAHACYESEREGVINVLVDKHTSGKKLNIDLRDNGTGIEPKNKNKLFTPLFSTKGVYAKKDSKLNQINGTGLGLSLAKQLLGKTDGSLRLKETNSTGTTFAITLTLAGDRTEKPDRAPKKETHSIPRDLKVYIADDSKENRGILKVYLKDYVQEFVEKEDGFFEPELFDDFEPDLIFLDWLMPAYGGADFLMRLEAHQKHKNLLEKVIIFSGLESSTQIDSWAKKIKGVLNKPIDQEKLVQSLGDFHV